MWRTRLYVVFLSASFLLCSTLPGIGQVGRIVGQLRVSGSDFPGHVLIDLQFRGANINTRYTDEQGRFEFDSLLDNAYRVLIRDERFYPVDELAIVNTTITATTVVNIQLTPREKSQAMESRTQGPTGRYLIDSREYRRHFPKPALREFDKGVEADQKGKRDDAIRHYEKTLSIAPEFYPAHNNLGSDYLSKSDFSAAQAQFEQAIKLNQSDAEAYLNLGNVFLMTKNYDAALQNLQGGLRRDPNSALGQFLLGSVYARLGKLSEAERALTGALAINPAMSRVHLELVNLYLQQNENGKASTELKAFLTDSPNDTLAPKAKELLKKLEAPR